MKRILIASSSALVLLCPPPPVSAQDAPPAALVFTENVPDLMRACAPQVKAAFLRRTQAAVDTGMTRAAAEERARKTLVTYTQGLAGATRDRVMSRRAGVIDRAKNGNPYLDHDMTLCMNDRRLAQVDGAVSTGLKAGSSKWKGGQR